MAFEIEQEVAVGILAMQGAFIEHQASIQRLDLNRKIHVILVRNPEDLANCDALIIPGGESTTIALLAKLAGLLEPLKAFTKTKPIWGTCAGAILLSRSVTGAKKGGQELLHGMSVSIARNGWGSQIESFEAPLSVQGLRNPEIPFTGVFIRAPVVLSITPSADDSPIEVIARLPPDVLPQSLINSDSENNTEAQTIVALRQGRHLLTTFHPELTQDDRFHEYFIRECVLSPEKRTV